jgi:hypothetical protein
MAELIVFPGVRIERFGRPAEPPEAGAKLAEIYIFPGVPIVRRNAASATASGEPARGRSRAGSRRKKDKRQ